MTGPERRLGVKSENSGINHAGAFIREQDTAGKKAAKMIQDIAPHKLNNHRKKHRMQAADFYIMMAERFWLEKELAGTRIKSHIRLMKN